MNRQETALLNELGRRYTKLTNQKEGSAMVERARSMPNTAEAIRYAYGKYTARRVKNYIRQLNELVGADVAAPSVAKTLDLFRTDPPDALAYIERTYDAALEEEISN